MYFLLKMDDFPASYVSLPEGKWVISPTYKWDRIGHIKTVTSNVGKKNHLENIVYHLFKATVGDFRVKLMEINSNLLSRHHFLFATLLHHHTLPRLDSLGSRQQEFTNQQLPKTHGSVKNGSLER